MKLTPLERWALGIALRKILDEELDGKREGSIRALLDSELLADYAAGRSDRRPVMVRGTKVGSLGIRSTPAHTEARLYLEDAKQFVAWLQSPDATSYLETFVKTRKCSELLL